MLFYYYNIVFNCFIELVLLLLFLLSSFKDQFQSLVLFQFCDARILIFFLKHGFHFACTTALSKCTAEFHPITVFSKWYLLWLAILNRKDTFHISCSLFGIYQVPLQLILMEPKQPEVSSNFLFLLVVVFPSFLCPASTLSDCGI